LLALLKAGCARSGFFIEREYAESFNPTESYCHTDSYNHAEIYNPTNPKVESYRDLIVWQRAIQTCVSIDALTRTFPREEVYGLTNQLRRCSVAVPSNIAEGYGRHSRDQYKYFLGVARGSNLELQTQLVIARALNFGGQDAIGAAEQMSFEAGRMLTAMLKKL
jgi:four helix bundle protein